MSAAFNRVASRWLRHLVTLALLSASALNASEIESVDIADQLVVGHWVEVRGDFLGQNQFRAERLEATRPRSQSRIWGIATVSKSGALSVLGRVIETTAQTQWRNGDLASADGQRVRVRGRRSSRGRILAERIEIRTPGTNRILGRIDGIRTSDGQLTFEILGYDVTLADTVRQRTEAPLGTLQRTPPAPLVSPFAKLIDPDDLVGDGFSLGLDTRLNVTQDVSFNSRRNFEIDRRDDRDIDERDDRDDSTHNLRLLMTWTPSARLTGLIDTRHRWRRRDLDQGVSENSEQARLAEAWLLVRDIGFGLDMQLGRKDYDEPREWLYDQNLDGVRLFKQTRKLHFELGLSSTLSDGSRADEDAVNTILYVSNRTGPRHLAGYVINRNYGAGRATTHTHYGLRAFGRTTPRIRGWAELAGLHGKRDGESVRAWATDVGVSINTLGPARATLTAGYAIASGDREGTTNTEFRQTGLQDNDARLGGLSPVRYYGELLDPELSNLRIATLGFAIRVLDRTSIELIGHTYHQSVASDRLRRTRLDRDPTGINTDLGWELDLVISVRQFARWDFELVGAHFDPGPGFPVGDSARLARLQVRYRY